jgi:transposase
METHKKEIKKLHHFGLNFSDISKQTGISRKTISKYISGDISDTKMRQPSPVDKLTLPKHEKHFIPSYL